MFAIEGNDIYLTRGDSLFIQVSLTKDEEPYIPTSGEVVRFAMKKKYTDEEVILQKVIPNDTLVLHLRPEDTKPLPMKSKYVYDLEFTDSSGEVDTFVKGMFYITEEVL